MPSERGFSLFEVIVALSLTTFLSLAFLSVVQGVQETDQTLHGILERDENLRLVPLLLSRFLWPVGNRRHLQDWPGLDSRDGVLGLRTDVDGTAGFPDGLPEAPFEDLLLRHKGSELQLRSGSGSHQPLIRHVVSFDHVHHSETLLTVEVLAGPEGSDPGSQTRVEVEFFLWNYRENLFPESIP